MEGRVAVSEESVAMWKAGFAFGLLYYKKS